MIVEDFSTKKASAYLDELPQGSKVLIAFWHGLGDTLMFIPLFDLLKSKYPQHQFTLSLGLGFGQNCLYAGSIDIPKADFLKEHDIAFVFGFPMSEGRLGITKAEYCCIKELGIDPKDALSLSPSFKGIMNQNNPFVAVHFQGTCLPGSTNPDEALSKRIWDDIVDAGYIPIDVHFKHLFHNPANRDYSWLTRTCRDIQPHIQTLFQVISNCRAFVGVASGPLVVSLALFPERTIYLQKHHQIFCYVKDFKNVIDLLNYDKQKLLGMLQAIEFPNCNNWK
jgi:hypothetical protein